MKNQFNYCYLVFIKITIVLNTLLANQNYTLFTWKILIKGESYETR